MRLRTRNLLLLPLPLTLPMNSCRSTGEECDACSSDGDCKARLACWTFTDGSKRCGSGMGATSSRTR